MKRVNLVEYFKLAEALTTGKRATSVDKNKGGNIWVSVFALPAKLRSFISDDNGFSASKHVAKELIAEIDSWISRHLYTDDSPPQLLSEKLDEDFHGWQYNDISTKIDAFNSVFEAECRDVDVYSVGQISIYRTSALVTAGAGIIPGDIQSDISTETLEEFNSAGKCLAFDLPTACGFHALRGLELVMDDYLVSFGVDTGKMKSWNDYIRAAKALIDDEKLGQKPSPKVAAMLDRMRELDRNPLMHPRDTLDEIQANMLFQLCAITVVEIARDMKASRESGREPANSGRKAVQRNAKKDAKDAA